MDIERCMNYAQEFNILPGSSPMILSIFRILFTALCDAKLYSKGLWDIRKQQRLTSLVGRVFDSEGGFIDGS